MFQGHKKHVCQIFKTKGKVTMYTFKHAGGEGGIKPQLLNG
jgi:hypothetical protein